MRRIDKIAAFHRASMGPKIIKKSWVSKNMKYHIDNNIDISQNIFRLESEAFYDIFIEARKLWKAGSLVVSKEDEFYLGTDIGKFAAYEGRFVPLDMPFAYKDDIVKESAKKKKKKKDPPLGKPKRGGSKKFYVYVRCNGKIKKISFGSPDMPLRVSEPDRRKSFVARHKCKQKKDRCTAGYWSCRIGRYPHLTGAKKKYTWW
tara:strand:- start:3109 stop:3717 length:609 start_codon:yes stop_codon:yes gene_type:complete